MDCAAICLLTTAVQFLPLPSTVNCSYCVEARSTYEHCFNDVIECAYRDPASLIICLNVFEKNNGDPAIIQHTIRCISYQDYYIDDGQIKEITAGGSCTYEHIEKCECDVCQSKTTTMIPELTTSVHKKKHHHHHRNGTHHHQRNQDREGSSHMERSLTNKDRAAEQYTATDLEGTSTTVAMTFLMSITLTILALF